MSEKDFWEGYVPEPTYTFKTPSEPLITVINIKPNYNMTFHRDGKQVGVLDFNGPEMTFSGDMDESAKLFLNWIANSFKGRLEQERADEREMCAKVCEEYADDSRTGSTCANAIRARSNT